MTYPRRLCLSACVAALLHVALFLMLGRVPVEARPVPVSPPIELNLEPEPQARHLVETPVPAEKPPDQTSNIADKNARAMDQTLQPGQNLGPASLKEDRFNTLPQLAAPKSPPPSPPQPPAEKKTETETEEEKAEEAEETPEEDVEPIQLARAAQAPQEQRPPQPNIPPAPEETTPRKGASKNRAVKRKGTTNFAAIEDEMAPYLAKIRRHVEQAWFGLLFTRYSGTSPTEAEFVCVITPQGEVADVRTQGKPKDILFDALCKEAIRKAGPFGTFPFEVPDMYQGKNLEIQWTFRFL
jgi:hypothetical protein